MDKLSVLIIVFDKRPHYLKLLFEYFNYRGRFKKQFYTEDIHGFIQCSKVNEK